MEFHSSNEDEEKQGNFLVRLCTRCFSEKDEKGDGQGVDVQDRKTSRYKTNSWTQFRWLVWRDFVNVLKNPFEIRLRLFLAVVSSSTHSSRSVSDGCLSLSVPRCVGRLVIHSFGLRSNCSTKYECFDLFDHYQYLVLEHLCCDTGKYLSSDEGEVCSSRFELVELYERISDLLQRTRRRCLSSRSILLLKIRHWGKVNAVQETWGTLVEF